MAMEFLLYKLRQIFGWKKTCTKNCPRDYDSFDSFTAYVDSVPLREAKEVLTISYIEKNETVSNHPDRPCEIPLNIGRFNQLTSLTITGCGFTNLPWSVVYLKALQQLDLSDNKLRILPNFICCLESLKVLHLQNNLLVVLPTSLLYLEKLSSIDLENNKTLVGPPYSLCMKGLGAIKENLLKRRLRTNLWEDSTAYYNSHSLENTYTGRNIPTLMMLAVTCILQSEQDFLMPTYVPPRLKSFLQEKVEEKRTSIQVAKCSSCRKFFSNSYIFDSHICVGSAALTVRQ